MQSNDWGDFELGKTEKILNEQWSCGLNCHIDVRDLRRKGRPYKGKNEIKHRWSRRQTLRYSFSIGMNKVTSTLVFKINRKNLSRSFQQLTDSLQARNTAIPKAKAGSSLAPAQCSRIKWPLGPRCDCAAYGQKYAPRDRPPWPPGQ